MKRIVLAALAAATFAPVAFAKPPQPLLSATDRAEVLRIVPSADLSALTPAQAAALAAIIYSGDRHARGGQIRAILN